MAVPVKNLKRTHTEPSLKAALLRLMKVKPFAKITIKELCEEAGVYRSTFYCHYANTEELLAAIQNEISAVVDKAYDGLVSKRLSPVGYTTELLEYVKSGKYDWTVLLGNYGKEAYEFRVKFVSHITEQFSGLLADIGSAFDRDYIPGYLVAGSLNIVSKWVENGCDTAIVDIANLIVRLSEKLAN